MRNGAGTRPPRQQRRERLRLEAAGRFARGDGINEIARDLRVTPGSVRRWRRAWAGGGTAALRSRGPVSREKLSGQQWARLEAELRKGPLAHGFAGDQRWTLGRIKTLIGKVFHVGYTAEGVWEADAPARLVLPGPGAPGARTRRCRGRGVEGRGVARYKSAARDLGAYVRFEDEAGQGLRPPKGRTWAPRGARPVVYVRGAGGGRVSIAGVACYRPGDRPHLFFKLLVYHRRKGEPKGFSWQDYRDLIIVTDRQLAAPLIWCWDNLNIHLAPELADFAAGEPGLAADLPAAGLRAGPQSRRGHLVTAQARHGQLRRRRPERPGPHRQAQAEENPVPAPPIDGCLAATGLKIELSYANESDTPAGCCSLGV